MRRHVRHGELESLRARLQAARAGGGGHLQIAGPAGIGTSALLAEILADPTLRVPDGADIPWRVVRIHGAEDEMTMPWAGLCQLVAGLRTTVSLLACGGASSPADHTRDAERVLTPHELQVARLSVEGHSMREIGAAMFISPRTVETHLGVIYRKLGVKNRAGLAAAAHHDPALRTGHIA